MNCYLLLIYFNFSFIVLPIATVRFVIVLINKHDDDDEPVNVELSVDAVTVLSVLFQPPVCC